jgi:hypothetical protein
MRWGRLVHTMWLRFGRHVQSQPPTASSDMTEHLLPSLIQHLAAILLADCGSLHV